MVIKTIVITGSTRGIGYKVTKVIKLMFLKH